MPKKNFLLLVIFCILFFLTIPLAALTKEDINYSYLINQDDFYFLQNKDNNYMFSNLYFNNLKAEIHSLDHDFKYIIIPFNYRISWLYDRESQLDSVKFFLGTQNQFDDLFINVGFNTQFMKLNGSSSLGTGLDVKTTYKINHETKAYFAIDDLVYYQFKMDNLAFTQNEKKGTKSSLGFIFEPVRDLKINSYYASSMIFKHFYAVNAEKYFLENYFVKVGYENNEAMWGFGVKDYLLFNLIPSNLEYTNLTGNSQFWLGFQLMLPDSLPKSEVKSEVMEAAQTPKIVETKIIYKTLEAEPQIIYKPLESDQEKIQALNADLARVKKELSEYKNKYFELQDKYDYLLNSTDMKKYILARLKDYQEKIDRLNKQKSTSTKNKI